MKVSIYVWLPVVESNNKKNVSNSSSFFKIFKKGKGCNVGHATIQTHGDNGIYASFWPEEEEIPASYVIESSVRGQLVKSLEADIGLERRDPDRVIELYCLNVDKINNAFNSFRNSNCKWEITGSAFFGKANTRNCSGLCAFLLSKGGIDKYIKYNEQSYSETTGIIYGLTNTAYAVSAVSGPVGVVIVGGVTFLVATAVGGLVGGLAGATVDTFSEIKNIVTPGGIAALAEYVKNNSKDSQDQEEEAYSCTIQ